MERRFISVRTCADIIGLHIKTIYSLIARGEISAGRVGRSIRIDLQALEKRLKDSAKANR